MSQGWSYFLHSLKLKESTKLTWSLVDQHGSFLDTTRSILTKSAPSADIQSSRIRIEEFLSRFQFDASSQEDTLHALLMGYLWNELNNNPKARRLFMEKLAYLVTKSAIIVAVEPQSTPFSASHGT